MFVRFLSTLVFFFSPPDFLLWLFFRLLCRCGIDSSGLPVFVCWVFSGFVLVVVLGSFFNLPFLLLCALVVRDIRTRTPPIALLLRDFVSVLSAVIFGGSGAMRL